jgi:hypothetical protein
MLLSTTARKARSKLANSHKFLGADHPDTHNARRDFEVAKLHEHAARVVAGWPPPTEEQLQHIAALLRTGSGAQ